MPQHQKPAEGAAKLKSCPFCGGDAYIGGDGVVHFFVGCSACYCAVGEAYDRSAMPEHMFWTADEAIAAWNRRALLTPPAPAPEVEQPRSIKDITGDRRSADQTSPHAAYCDVALQDALIEADDAGERIWIYDDELFDASLAANGYRIVPLAPPPRAAEADGWRPIETAPKSTSTEIEGGHFVRGIYLLGFCPEEGARLEGCMSVIWWEPNLHGIGKGAWINDGDMEVHPTHWMPLPAPPSLRTPAPGGE